MSTTFTDLVKSYGNSLVNRIKLTSKFKYEDMASNVILHKISKHTNAGNARSVAKYICLWYKEGFGELPKEVYDLANTVGVFFKEGEHSGYINAKGQKRYFVVEK